MILWALLRVGPPETQTFHYQVSKKIHEPGTKKKKGRRSGGIILYIKDKFTRNNAITKIKSSKNFIWVKINKTLCGTNSDIFLCSAYIRPRKGVICPENDILFQNLSVDIDSYSNLGKVVLMGDFNSRTGTLDDFVNLDSTCSNNFLPDSYTTDIIIEERNNLDKEVNEQGKCLMKQN